MADEERLQDPIDHIGLSTDTKNESNIPPGAQWFETDTGQLYVFRGGEWVLDTSNQFYIKQLDGTFERASQAFPIFTQDFQTVTLLTQVVDALERIQQQGGKTNDGQYLEPGQRFK